MLRREEQDGEDRSEISVEGKVVPFEDIADRSGQERPLYG